MPTFADATPFQNVPSMKNAAGLSGDNEYAAIWTGQSNSRPRGYPADGLSVAEELRLWPTGIDMTTVVVPDLPTRTVGMIEDLMFTGVALGVDSWITGTWLRFGASAFTLGVISYRGYAKVLANGGASIRVQWISLPENNSANPGYLVREVSRFYEYPNVRVLTPFMPIRDIEPPPPTVIGAPLWFAPTHSDYFAPNARLASDGRRLLLPAPFNGTTSVASFEDLAVFLPLTRREGSIGYGISEIADASFAATGTPTGHPILDITAGVFTFANGIGTDPDLAGGYLIIDWEQGGATKRSWARIASNDATTFTADAASWLGDGVPDAPDASTVTFDVGAEKITWTGHTFVEGDRVTFTTAGTLPDNVESGRVYRVRNPEADKFQISLALYTEIIDIGPGAGSGTHTGTQVWPYTAWVPHWRDNPNMWVPGPEFARPNEDQQPHAPYVHWRARGQLLYASTHGIPTGRPPPEPETGPTFDPWDKATDFRFGAMLPFGWRLSGATGKRINMVCLGVNGAPLSTTSVPNTAGGYHGNVGWWSYERYGYGLPLEDTNSMLAGRIKRLITYMAAQALLAENNAKPLKFLSACHVQGETDSLFDMAREIYIALITDYKRWLRDLVTSIGASPFEGEAQMPFAQPLLTHDPWESNLHGSVIDFQTFGYDAFGDANNGIRIAHTTDEFAAFTITEDIPKVLYNSGVIDNAHFSGQGMVWQGSRLSAAILDLLEHALSYSSAVLATTNARILRVANLALVYVGQGANPITSLSDNTTEARLVSLMWQEAARQLLSMRQWSWAIRREPATMVKHTNENWNYCYVVPARAVTPLAILPPNTEEATAINTLSVEPTSLPPVALPDPPEPFEIQSSPSGHRLLFCNVAEIPGDLTETAIADGVLHPERLSKRPTIVYVDKQIDPERMSDSFATALTWYLASMLAPALVKGQEGEAVAARCLLKCGGFLRIEAGHETVTQQPTKDFREEHRPSWMKARQG